jgi:DNA-binding CsgD family transcriptional regulator/PAS domain-containing protein
MDLKSASDVIGIIYDAALEPNKWPAALKGMCTLFDAKAAAIQMFEPADGNKMLFSIEHGTDPKWTEMLHNKYAALCPIGPMIMLAELDQTGSIFDNIDEEEFLETRFYREWCAPQGYYDMIGGLIARRVDEVGTVSVLGTKARGRFSAADIEMMNLVAPQVRRAATLAGLLGHRSVVTDGLEAIMDALPTAVFLTGKSGNLLRANAAADALLSDGKIVQKTDAGLILVNPASDRALRDAMVGASRKPVLITVPKGDGNMLSAAVFSPDDAGATRAILINEPKADLPAHGKHLVQAFGLTPRELAVLMPMLQGSSPAEIADQLGVGMATVRTHVARLLDKTGTERQSDLILKVMGAMAPVRMS